jgi:hypothetical protein
MNSDTTAEKDLQQQQLLRFRIATIDHENLAFIH